MWCVSTKATQALTTKIEVVQVLFSAHDNHRGLAAARQPRLPRLPTQIIGVKSGCVALHSVTLYFIIISKEDQTLSSSTPDLINHVLLVSRLIEGDTML